MGVELWRHFMGFYRNSGSETGLRAHNDDVHVETFCVWGGGWTKKQHWQHWFVIFFTLGGEYAVVTEDKKYHRTKQLELKFQTRLDYIGCLDRFAKNMDKHHIFVLPLVTKIRWKFALVKNQWSIACFTQLSRQYYMTLIWWRNMMNFKCSRLDLATR